VLVAAGAIGVAARVIAMGSTALEAEPTLVLPTTSARCREEMAFLLRNGLPSDAGGPCAAQSPSLLLLLGPDGLLPGRAGFGICIAADLVAACLLLRLSTRRSWCRPAHAHTCVHAPTAAGWAAASAVLCAPWTVGACAAGSAATLPIVAILSAAEFACEGRATAAAAALSLATLFSPDAVWLLPATAALSASAVVSAADVKGGDGGEGGTLHSCEGDISTASRFAAIYGMWLCALLTAHAFFPGLDGLEGWYVMLGHWIRGTPMHGGPNVGLWWYLLALVYEAQRAPFMAALHVLPKLCLPCLALALYAPHSLRHSSSCYSSRAPPCLVVALSLLILVATKAQPTLSEGVLGVAAVVAHLDGRLVRRTAHLPLAAATFGVGTLVSPALLSAWLDHRQLNANFFYASSLCLAAGQLLFAYDVTAAAMHADAHDVIMQEDLAAARVLQRGWRLRAGRA